MKSTVTDRNVTYSEERKLTNQVTSLMLDVESILSEIGMMMSNVNIESRKKVLPCVSKILYLVETIVSCSSQPQHTVTDLWWDESGVHLEESYGQDDSILSDVFLFSDATSSSSICPSRTSSTSSSSRESSRSSSSKESSRSSSSKESPRSSSSRGSSMSSSSAESSRSSSLSRSFSEESLRSSSDISSDSNTFGEHNLSEWDYSEIEQDVRQLEDEILFESILQVINIVAPNNIFNRGKSERRRRKKVRKRLKAAVIPHLFPVWQNAGDLVTPRESVTKPVPNVEVVSPYPIIDMSKVNKRFLSNLPEPERFPVLGCSQDPKFYEPRYEVQYDAQLPPRQLKSRYEENYPFGCAFGFDTNLGIIGWSSQEGAVHGYIWTGYRWVLHAQRPQDREKVKQKVGGDFNFKKKFKRKKESR